MSAPLVPRRPTAQQKLEGATDFCPKDMPTKLLLKEMKKRSTDKAEARPLRLEPCSPVRGTRAARSLLAASGTWRDAHHRAARHAPHPSTQSTHNHNHQSEAPRAPQMTAPVDWKGYHDSDV